MKKKRLKKKVKIGLFIILGVLVCGGAIYIWLNNDTKTKIKPVEIIDKLDDYSYVLSDNETDYYNDLFKDLKEELSKDEVDYDNYASIITKLFIADFFNLDNKVSKNDIGGTQFIYASYQTSFEKYAKESIYNNVLNNMYGNRKQELPVVKSVEITGTTNEKYNYLNKVDNNAYKMSVKIHYAKDLNYQESATIYIIHNDKKLEIVRMD